MSDPISTAATLVTMIDKISKCEWSAIVVLVFIIPPVLVIYGVLVIARAIRSLEKRVIGSDFKTETLVGAMSNKYENNVLLVKQYEKLANDLASIIHLNTQTMTRLADRIVL
ncbi:MAG: hypothetical protein CSA34_00425 [Desulfobulbus propionicus]|nr:MAG: hypothetical protein CSA34_00425 [Desulfobulbus propionicus]